MRAIKKAFCHSPLADGNRFEGRTTANVPAAAHTAISAVPNKSQEGLARAMSPRNTRLKHPFSSAARRYLCAFPASGQNHFDT